MAKRKKPTLKQRTTPCRYCSYPLSQQHHIFEFSKYRDNEYTIPLCANCHELFHVLQNLYRHKTKHSLSVAVHVLTAGGDYLAGVLIHLCILVLVVEREIGLEYKNLSQREQVLLVTQKFSVLFDAYRPHHNTGTSEE